MNRIILVAVSLSFASPAFASECPALWQQITERMNGAHVQLSEADRTKLDELRRQGEEFHHMGDHPKAIAALSQALALLG